MKFKGFWKEYWELCKATGRWLKKYWFLFLIWNVIIGILEYVFLFGWDAILPKKKDNKELTEEDEAE